MKTIRIRTFTILSLLLILTFPWVFYVATHLLVMNTWSIGKVSITQTDSKMTLMIGVLIGLFLAFLFVWGMYRKYILKPLEQMSQSARQIAEGDLEVQLSTSRITEIRDVHEGFSVMVKGLKESFQKQTELEDERRFVIAALAHDLRTPLFALRGYLEGLEKGIADTPDKRAKYLAVCQEKSVQLDQLVEDLFTFTKSEFHGSDLHKAEVNVFLILQRSIENIGLQAERKNIRIELDYVENSMSIMGDAHLLERAMNNLLDNAVRHTPSHGKIYVTSKKENDKFIFSVQDTGRGFLPGDFEHVFEPLYRGESSRNRSTGGTGLGLTISRRIIRQHGGDLVAGNHPDGGAVITGWLPIENKCSP